MPISSYFLKLIKQKKILYNDHLYNGDVYQVVFTAKKKYRNAIIKSSMKWNQKLTRIGYITSNITNYIKSSDKLKKINDYHGYIHNFN